MIDNESKFNTNNAWGFGGGIGVRTDYKSGAYSKKGKAYYRHMPPTKFETYMESEGDILIDCGWVWIGDTQFKLKKDMLAKAILFIIETNPSRTIFQDFVKQLHIK
jgi:hypothetical protein